MELTKVEAKALEFAAQEEIDNAKKFRLTTSEYYKALISAILKLKEINK